MRRRREHTEPMHITEAELDSMTADLTDLHESTFPEARSNLADAGADIRRLAGGIAASRRSVLLGAGGAMALGLLAACSSSGSSNSSAPTAPTSPSPSGGKYMGDLEVVALAAALENLAVAAYDGALMRAKAGKLGTVPPAIGNFVTTARKQHADHAAAWNGVLTGASLPAVKDAPLTIAPGLVAMLGKTDSVPAVVKLALSLEDAAAQTYTFATANVTSPGGIATAATIQPVEAMHASILNFVLGQYPVPNSFIGVTKAVSPSALIQS